VTEKLLLTCFLLFAFSVITARLIPEWFHSIAVNAMLWMVSFVAAIHSIDGSFYGAGERMSLVHTLLIFFGITVSLFAGALIGRLARNVARLTSKYAPEDQDEKSPMVAEAVSHELVG